MSDFLVITSMSLVCILTSTPLVFQGYSAKKWGYIELVRLPHIIAMLSAVAFGITAIIYKIYMKGALSNTEIFLLYLIILTLAFAYGFLFSRRAFLVYGHSHEQIVAIVTDAMNKKHIDYKLEDGSVIKFANGSSIIIEASKIGNSISIHYNKFWNIPSFNKILPLVRENLKIKTEKSKKAAVFFTTVGIIYVMLGIALYYVS